MKLISCDGCGLVYDQDKIQFCHEDHLEDRPDEFIWNGNTYVPFVKCGSCDTQILNTLP